MRCGGLKLTCYEINLPSDRKLNRVSLQQITGVVIVGVGVAEFQVVEIDKISIEVGASVPGA